MLNALARHRWLGQEVGTDICIRFIRVVCFTARLNCLFLHVCVCVFACAVYVSWSSGTRACACAYDTAFKYFQKLDFPREMTGVISSVRDENNICIQLVTATTLKF